MRTIQEHITERQRQFRKLSISRQRTLARKARQFIARSPHMRDASNFWRGLSAAQLLEAHYST